MSLHIALPETLRAFVEEQVATEGYHSPDDYVRALVRKEQQA